MDLLSKLFSGMRISASGLAAERARADVIARNIANAHTTRTPEGGPYRRQLVRFEPLLQRLEGGGTQPGGVRVAAVTPDMASPMERVFDPSHPDADPQGFVLMPNVNATLEMTDMITAMRAYEANISVQESFVSMAERALRLAQ